MLIINEENQLRKFMQISGLHPIIYWTSNFFFHLILTSFYSFFLYFIYSLNDEEENFYQNNLTFQQIIKRNNFKIKQKFFSFTFLLNASTLPFIYLITS